MRSLVRVVLKQGTSPEELLQTAAATLGAQLDQTFGVQEINPGKGVYCMRTKSDEAVEQIKALSCLEKAEAFPDEQIVALPAEGTNGT